MRRSEMPLPLPRYQARGYNGISYCLAPGNALFVREKIDTTPASSAYAHAW